MGGTGAFPKVMCEYLPKLHGPLNGHFPVVQTRSSLIDFSQPWGVVPKKGNHWREDQ